MEGVVLYLHMNYDLGKYYFKYNLGMHSIYTVDNVWSV